MLQNLPSNSKQAFQPAGVSTRRSRRYCGWVKAWVVFCLVARKGTEERNKEVEEVIPRPSHRLFIIYFYLSHRLAMLLVSKVLLVALVLLVEVSLHSVDGQSRTVTVAGAWDTCQKADGTPVTCELVSRSSSPEYQATCPLASSFQDLTPWAKWGAVTNGFPDKSSLGFTGVRNLAVTPGIPFLLGILQHLNMPILNQRDFPDQIRFTLSTTAIFDSETIVFSSSTTLSIDETENTGTCPSASNPNDPNDPCSGGCPLAASWTGYDGITWTGSNAVQGTCCPYETRLLVNQVPSLFGPCSDRIITGTLTGGVFRSGTKEYQLTVKGFSPDCNSATGSSAVQKFVSQENTMNVAYLYGVLQLKCLNEEACRTLAPGMSTQCATGFCDQSSGTCLQLFNSSSTPCDDGDVCTSGDTCDGNGFCVGTRMAVGSICGWSDICSAERCLLQAGGSLVCRLDRVPPSASVTCAVDSESCKERICDGTGGCTAYKIGVGWPCPPLNSTVNPCLAWQCDASRTCSMVPVVGYCTQSTNNGCLRQTGTCQNSVCVNDPQPQGIPCTGSPALPVCNTYQCDGSGSCAAVALTGPSCGPATECRSYACNSGNCEAINVPLGTPCNAGGSTFCTPQYCDGLGQCMPYPVPNDTACGGIPTECASLRCQGGVCQPSPINDGRNCSVGIACRYGVCSNTNCVLQPDPAPANVSCQDTNPAPLCYEAVCDAGGACVNRPRAGGLCDAILPILTCAWPACAANGTCIYTPRNGGMNCAPAFGCKLPGRCDDVAIACVQLNAPVGTDCSASMTDPPPPCQVYSCMANGTCGTSPIADGATCVPASSGACESTSVGTCAAGVCRPEPLAPGVACTGPSSPPTCMEYKCDSNRLCQLFNSSTVGCTGPNLCYDYFCVQGQCQFNPNPVPPDPCDLTPPPDCRRYSTCVGGTCILTTEPNGASCSSCAASACNTCQCMAGVCQAIPLNGDQVGCSGPVDVSNPCLQQTCSSGACIQVNATDGLDCSPSGKTFCNTKECSAGRCVNVRPQDGTVVCAASATVCNRSVCINDVCQRVSTDFDYCDDVGPLTPCRYYYCINNACPRTTATIANRTGAWPGCAGTDSCSTYSCAGGRCMPASRPEGSTCDVLTGTSFRRHSIAMDEDEEYEEEESFTASYGSHMQALRYDGPPDLCTSYTCVSGKCSTTITYLARNTTCGPFFNATNCLSGRCVGSTAPFSCQVSTLPGCDSCYDLPCEICRASPNCSYCSGECWGTTQIDAYNTGRVNTTLPALVCNSTCPTPSPSASPSRTPSSSASASTSPTPSTSPSRSPSPSATSSASSSPSPSSSSSATSSPTPSPSPTSSASSSSSPSSSSSATSSPTPSPSPTTSPTPSLSPTPSASSSVSPSESSSATSSPTPSPSPTSSASSSASPSVSPSATSSRTTSPSPTSSASSSASPSVSPSTPPTPSASSSSTTSPSYSLSPSATPSVTPSTSSSRSSSATPSVTPSTSSSGSSSPSPPASPSITPSRSSSPTPTASTSATPSRSSTPSASPSSSSSTSRSASRSGSFSPSASTSPSTSGSTSSSVSPSRSPRKKGGSGGGGSDSSTEIMAGALTGGLLLLLLLLLLVALAVTTLIWRKSKLRTAVVTGIDETDFVQTQPQNNPLYQSQVKVFSSELYMEPDSSAINWHDDL